VSNLGIVKNYVADVAISPYRIVKPGSADGNVTFATGPTDLLIGVTTEVGPAAGERTDVAHSGIAYVEAGAAIPRGARITSDTLGRGIAAAPAAGTNNSVVGSTLETATAAGDVIRVLLSLSTLQG